MTDAPLLASLLESGLDPDAADSDGRTLLMSTRDLALARVLLAAGADPNARQRWGVTALMSSNDKEPALVALLLEAGADVHAVDDAGRSAVDYFGVNDELRSVLESRAGGPLREARWQVSHTAGRTDWLVIDRDPSAELGPSTVELGPRPVSPGDVATVDIRITNRSSEARLLDVEAGLNVAALFVGASHEGAIRNPAQPGLLQAIRWPPLTLPAHSQGRLEMRVIARSDATAEDLGVDVRVWTLPEPQPEVLVASERLGAVRRQTGTAGRGGLAALLVGGAVVGWLLTRLARRRASDASVVVRAVVAGAALALGAAAALLAWTLAEPFVAFEEAACTILDRRLQLRSARSTSRGGSARAVPVVAVRIGGDAGPAVATGFSAGFVARSPSELRAFPLGATVPCWVDPARPERFTLVRRPPASGLLGLTVLGAFAFVLGWAARRVGVSGSQDGAASPAGSVQEPPRGRRERG